MEIEMAFLSSNMEQTSSPASDSKGDQLDEETSTPQPDLETGDNQSSKQPISWITWILWPLKSHARNAARKKSRREKLSAIIQLNVMDAPEGYLRLATFLDSSGNFMLYRRFGFLQARLLLYKQDEMRQLEVFLDEMDKEDAVSDPILLRSRIIDDVVSRRRQELLGHIEIKFKEYASLIVAAEKLVSLDKVLEGDYNSVKGYFDDERRLADVEEHIYRKDDIITLKPHSEVMWIDVGIEKFLRWTKWAPLQERSQKAVSATTNFGGERATMLANLILATTTQVLLVVPVWILWRLTVMNDALSSIKKIIAVLFISTLLFSAVLIAFTRAKRHEILESAAAYCAVLVVFVGNVKQIGN